MQQTIHPPAQHPLQCPAPRQRCTPSPLHAIHLPLRPTRRVVVPRASAESEPLSYARDVTKPRFVQHKTEAFWFYRFLSIVYDHIVNPGHWTVDMRTDALEPAKLDSPNLKVVPAVGNRRIMCTVLGHW